MPSSRYSNRFGGSGFGNAAKPQEQVETETADQIQARITREQYDDYKNRFAPWVKKLNDQVSDKSIAESKLQWNKDINSSTNQALKNGLIASNLNTSRFGVNEGGRAKSANNTLGLLSAAKNRTARTNATNQDIDDRRMSLLSGQSTRGAM